MKLNPPPKRDIKKTIVLIIIKLLLFITIIILSNKWFDWRLMLLSVLIMWFNAIKPNE